MDKDERQKMMNSMMEQFFGGMGADEKKEMVGAMMSKMCAGLDMKEMMGMMSGGEGPGKMQDMMAKMMLGDSEQHMSQMPEMMMTVMMPHCIGMMLPAIDKERRADVVSTLLSSAVEKGTSGMSDEERKGFMDTVMQTLKPKD